MRTELINYDDLERSMYAVYPDGERICCYEYTLITILRDADSYDDISTLLEEKSVCKLLNSQKIILLFPNPICKKWNYSLDSSLPDDLSDIPEMIRRFNYQPAMDDVGIYHIMHNARYLIGTGTGASMVHTIASCNPVNVAGIFTIGGSISEKAAAACVNSPVPAILQDADETVKNFFRSLNQTDSGCDGYFYNKINDAQFVYLSDEKAANHTITGKTLRFVWEQLCAKVCRWNSCFYGDAGPRTVRDHYKFNIHEDDPLLGDNNGLPHTWFEYIPDSVNAGSQNKVPLILFNHGGADTPGNICNTLKLHEVAEKEGFIVVYPWCSAKWGWNLDLEEDKYDDIAYLKALIHYMKEKYPIDETRIYIGGFSNGSAMAQIFAMTNPGLIAAVLADNTGFIKNRNTKPFAIAGREKLLYDYRMPIWYIYGTRDKEYPVVRGSGQQVQYDFWKAYNNITWKLTPYCNEPDAPDVGVAGDQVEVYTPNPRYPFRKYTTHRFFSNDKDPVNYYNYTLAEGKGHDCNPEDAWLGWNYISNFRRLPDGKSMQIKK